MPGASVVPPHQPNHKNLHITRRPLQRVRNHTTHQPQITAHHKNPRNQRFRQPNLIRANITRTITICNRMGQTPSRRITPPNEHS